MSTDEASSARFKYPEEDLYSPIDMVAVVALLCGLGSVMAVIFSPVFVGFGVLGIIFGLSAFVRISRSEGTLSGFWVAAIGISLSVCFLTGYFTYSTARDAAICARARKHAEQWIEMIQDGKLMEAHQLTRSFFDRLLPGTDLNIHYDSKMKLTDSVNPEANSLIMDVAGTPYQQMQDFFAHPIMSVIKRDGHDCKVEFPGSGSN